MACSSLKGLARQRAAGAAAAVNSSQTVRLERIGDHFEEPLAQKYFLGRGQQARSGPGRGVATSPGAGLPGFPQSQPTGRPPR